MCRWRSLKEGLVSTIAFICIDREFDETLFDVVKGWSGFGAWETRGTRQVR